MPWFATVTVIVLLVVLLPIPTQSSEDSGGTLYLDPHSDEYKAYMLYNEALQQSREGRVLDSIATYYACLELKPDLVEAMNNLGGQLNAVKRTSEAYAMYVRGMGVLHDRADPAEGGGVGMPPVRREDRWMAASYQNNLGHIEQGYPNAARNATAMTRARTHFERALEYHGEHVDALFNLGFTLERLGSVLEAQGLYARVLALDATHPSANLNVGNFHHKAGRLDEAAAHHRAVAANSGVAVKFRTNALNNLGQVLSEANDYEGSLEAYRAGLSFAPSDTLTLAHATIARRMLCDWRQHDEQRIADAAPEVGFAALRVRLDARLEECFAASATASDPALLPYDALFLPDEFAPPAWRRRVGRAHMSSWIPMRATVPPPPAAADAASAGRELRIAYLSYDFREHPMGFLTLGLLEAHAAAQQQQQRVVVHATAFSYGKDDASTLRARITAAVGATNFIDIREVESDQIAAGQIAQASPDLIIDLMAHTKGARLGLIAAQHPATIVVNYLGFPGSLGSAVATYVIADRFTVAAEFEIRGATRREFSEKVVLLPHSYQINSYRELSLPPPPLVHNHPSTLTITKGAAKKVVVLANYNKLDKLEPRAWATWMATLRRTPHAVLHLVNPSKRSRRRIRANLQREAAARGISPTRIVFVERMPRREHLIRVADADLFLDTFRYNAHTTATDALWRGVPVVTLQGPPGSFASRVAAGHLVNAGAPQLVTQTLRGFEATSVRLAHSPSLRRAARRLLLSENSIAERGSVLGRSPLFNTAQTAQHIISAYQTMHELQSNGVMPRHIIIAERMEQ